MVRSPIFGSYRHRVDHWGEQEQALKRTRGFEVIVESVISLISGRTTDSLAESGEDLCHQAREWVHASILRAGIRGRLR